jgi:electron transfer flavoprotein alpha/beta subunit
MGAKKKPQETVAPSGTAESATTVLALSPPPARGEARKIEDDGSAAEKIVEFLAEKRLV